MELKELLTDDDAVSPVIGVILMVAITVILAAVIASTVLSLGEQNKSETPTAELSGEWEDCNDNDDGNGKVTIKHESGDKINAGNVYIRGTGKQGSSTNDCASSEIDMYDGDSNNWADARGISSTSRIKAGKTIVVATGETHKLDVVFETNDAGDTATLSEVDREAN